MVVMGQCWGGIIGQCPNYDFVGGAKAELQVTFIPFRNVLFKMVAVMQQGKDFSLI